MAMWTDFGKYYQNCEKLIARVEQDLQQYSDQLMCMVLCKMLPDSKVLVVLDYALAVNTDEQNKKAEAIQLQQNFGQHQTLMVNMTLNDLHTYLVQLNKKD